MTIHIPPVLARTHRSPATYLVFNAQLELLGDSADAGWPPALLSTLCACVRQTLAKRARRFRPAGFGSLWRIERIGRAGAERIAVFVERAG
jgi:hypothetical protein